MDFFEQQAVNSTSRNVFGLISNFNMILNGTLSLWTKTQDYPQLYLTNCDNTRETLKTTESERGRCHLRLHISMDGNSKTETQILFKRCNMFQKVYSNSMSMKFITYKNKLL